MDGPRQGSGARRVTTAASLVLALVCVPAAGAADGPSAAPAPLGTAGTRAIDFSIGALTGATRLDPSLADYQWNVAPRAAWGVRALAGRGRWAAGLELWRTGTAQTIAGASASPNVSVTRLDVVGQGGVAHVWGVQVLAVGSVGRVRLAYDPDRVTIAAGGTTVVVDLAAIDAWNAGAGLALVRDIAGPWQGSLEVDHHRFAMDTAHRNGGAIELGRETFGNWSARVGLSWRTRRS